MKFIRVMAGSNNRDVYYILKPNASGNGHDVTSLCYRMKRTNRDGLLDNDWAYGDYYVATADYLNLLLPMSDNTNSFSVPTDLNAGLKSLFNTPAFGARYGFNPREYLQSYLPNNSQTQYIISGNYTNNLHSGYTYSYAGVRSGNIALANASAAGNNSGQLTMETKKFQDIYESNPGQYTVILANDGDSYQQKLSLKVNDQSGCVEDAYIEYNGNRLDIDQTATLTPGDTFTVYFKMPGIQLESLSMVRKNAEDAASLLLDSSDLNLLEPDGNGYYSYTTTMPYSPIEIVVNTGEGIYAEATIERFSDPHLVDQFRLENYDQVLQDEKKSMKVLCGSAVDVVIGMVDFTYLDKVTMVTDNVETVLFNQDNYDQLLEDRGDGTRSMSVAMPEKGTRFVVYIRQELCYDLTLTRKDDRYVIKEFSASIADASFTSGGVPAGTEMTLHMVLGNPYAFEELTMVTGGQTTVLLDKQTYCEAIPDTNCYELSFIMPDGDTELILTTKPITDTYEPAGDLKTDDQGRFLIYDYDDLRSVAYYVNIGEEKYTYGHYLLMNDIDVENRSIESIGADRNAAFRGIFDGNGHTISNYTLLVSTSQHGGLFGRIRGGTVKDLRLAGLCTLKNTGSSEYVYSNGVAYSVNNDGSIVNVHVDLSLALDGFYTIAYLSGIAHEIESRTTIDRCLVQWNVDLPNVSLSTFAGIACSVTSAFEVTNCGVNCNINVKSCDTAYGVFQVYNGAYIILNNCYTACTFSGDVDRFYALCSTAQLSFELTNCYYLDTMPQDGDIATAATRATMEDFNSGKVAMWLQAGVTETDDQGNPIQTWGQIIDAPGERELFPVLSENAVYNVIASGCTESSYTYKLSNYPEHNYSHNYKSTVITTSSCTCDGEWQYTCADCGDSYTKIYPSTGHVFWMLVDSVAAGCTTDGYMVILCRVCGGRYGIVVAGPTGHSYQETRVEPTCTEAGSVTYTCSGCSDSYQETLSAVGHQFDKITEIVDATCTEDGHIAYSCTGCSETMSETIFAYGHTEEAVPGTAADCTNTGLTDGTKCSVCGETIKAQETVPASGHIDADDSGRCDNCQILMQPAKLSFVSISLKGNIALNYYMLLSDEVLADSTAYMQFSMADGSVIKKTISESVKHEYQGETYYVFTCAVDAKEMSDQVISQFFYEGGETKEYAYSVQTYANYMLENSMDENVKRLVAAMLNHGAAAQIHFGYRTDAPANAGLETPDYSNVDISGFNAVTGQGTELAQLYSASLLLKSETTLRFFFTAPITATYNGQELEVKQRSGLYYVDVVGISAKDLDEDVTITINDGVNTAQISFNPMAYCQGVLKAAADAFSVEMKDLVRAFYLYNQAANVYFEGK